MLFSFAAFLREKAIESLESVQNKNDENYTEAYVIEKSKDYQTTRCTCHKNHLPLFTAV